MENNATDFEWRMYGITPYNISEIQKGIQYGHAVQEYNNLMFQNKNFYTDATEPEKFLIDGFDKWREEDKTFMVMSGGTTNDDIEDKFYGSMNRSVEELRSMGITIGLFREPDLGNQISGVVFLADERCFKKRPYPFEDPTETKVYMDFRDCLYVSDGQIQEDKKKFIQETGGKINPTLENVYSDAYTKWVDMIGGEQNVLLRNFISKLRFA